MFCGRAGEKFLVNLLIINIPQNPVLFNTKNKHIDKYVPCMLQHEKDHVFSSSEPNPISSLSFSVSAPRAMISATFSATVSPTASLFLGLPLSLVSKSSFCARAKSASFSLASSLQWSYQATLSQAKLSHYISSTHGSEIYQISPPLYHVTFRSIILSSSQAQSPYPKRSAFCPLFLH